MVKEVPSKFVDRFNEVIDVNDTVIYMDRSYTDGVLSEAAIDVGKVLKYLPKGGVVIRRHDGTDRRMLRIDKESLMKVDRKIMDRIMLEKLSTEIG